MPRRIPSINGCKKCATTLLSSAASSSSSYILSHLRNFSNKTPFRSSRAPWDQQSHPIQFQPKPPTSEKGDHSEDDQSPHYPDEETPQFSHSIIPSCREESENGDSKTSTWRSGHIPNHLIAVNGEGMRRFGDEFYGGAGTYNDHHPYKRHDRISSNDVEAIYKILVKFHTHVPKLEMSLHNLHLSVRPSLVDTVLKRCGEAGNLAFRFFMWASKQPGYAHNSVTYRLMIKILGKMRQFGIVWALLDEMKRESPHLVTPDTFIILLRRFAKANMVRKAIEVLDEMPKFGCDPDDHTFGCLLDALCKNGHVKEAASLFEDMKVRFPPNLKNFTCMLNGWCKAGKLMEAKYVLVQMREAGFQPDIVVYNTLLGGYACLGKMGDGLDLLREMKNRGCPPNATSYTTLIQSFCSRGRMDEASRLFDEMLAEGCDADVVTYTTLISGFSKGGKLDDAYKMLDRMKREGCSPNQMTYFYILAAHEKKEELPECIELIRNMTKSGRPPDLNIYNSLIRLACKLGQEEEALNAWNEMESSGLSPGIDTFTILIHGLLGNGSLMEACKYFKMMVSRGLVSVPQYGTLKELLNALLREEKLETALDVWEMMRTGGTDLNVFSYTIWIHALFDHGHVKEACRWCLGMLEDDLLPQPDTFAKLITGLRKIFNRQIAAEITEKVRKMVSSRNMSFKSYSRRGVKIHLEKQKSRSAGMPGKVKAVRRRRGHHTNSVF